MERRRQDGWGRSKPSSALGGFVTCRAAPLGRGMSIFPITRIDQVALVVRDLDASMQQYWDTLRIGPWVVYTYGPPFVPVQTFRGRSQSYRLRLALAQLQNVMVELIQPLSGDSIYFEHLDRKGPGLHH